MEGPGQNTVEMRLPPSGWVELRAAADRAALGVQRVGPVLPVDPTPERRPR